MTFRYIDPRTNPSYKYDVVLGDINYNFSLLSGGTSGGTSTFIQNGLNTYTGGTISEPTVNVSAATLDNLTVTNNSVFNGNIYTPQDKYFYTGSKGSGFYSDSSLVNPNNLIFFTDSGLTNTILSINDNGNFWIDPTPNGNIYLQVGTTTLNLEGLSDSLVLQGGTGGTIVNSNAKFNYFINIQSASTDNTLTDIFVRAANGDVSLRNVASIIASASSAITQVQNGINTYTGGTVLSPSVNISAATLNYLSATTISGGTLYSGSTNLYSIFQQIGVSVTQVAVQNGTNTYTGGTASLPTINVSALTINTLIASGSSQFGATTASSFSGGTVSGGTIFSGSTNLNTLFSNSIDSAIYESMIYSFTLMGS